MLKRLPLKRSSHHRPRVLDRSADGTTVNFPIMLIPPSRIRGTLPYNRNTHPVNSCETTYTAFAAQAVENHSFARSQSGNASPTYSALQATIHSVKPSKHQGQHLINRSGRDSLLCDLLGAEGSGQQSFLISAQPREQNLRTGSPRFSAGIEPCVSHTFLSLHSDTSRKRVGGPTTLDEVLIVFRRLLNPLVVVWNISDRQCDGRLASLPPDFS